jgi:hypothetical protein
LFFAHSGEATVSAEWAGEKTKGCREGVGFYKQATPTGFEAF